VTTTASLSRGWRARAAVPLLVIPVLLLFVPLNRLTRWLGRPRRVPKDTSDALTASWVDRQLHRLPWPWRHTCLRRSAVLYHLLRGAGRPVELWIGVRRTNTGALAAHAWLVLEGIPYLERTAEHEATFATIARFPEPEGQPG
jgi:hypothetical protein